MSTGRSPGGWRAGVYAGYGYTHTCAEGVDASSKAATYQIGAYGGQQFGALGLRLGASYAWQDVSADRTISALSQDLSSELLGTYRSGLRRTRLSDAVQEHAL